MFELRLENSNTVKATCTSLSKAIVRAEELKVEYHVSFVKIRNTNESKSNTLVKYAMQ